MWPKCHHPWVLYYPWYDANSLKPSLEYLQYHYGICTWLHGPVHREWSPIMASSLINNAMGMAAHIHRRAIQRGKLWLKVMTAVVGVDSPLYSDWSHVCALHIFIQVASLTHLRYGGSCQPGGWLANHLPPRGGVTTFASHHYQIILAPKHLMWSDNSGGEIGCENWSRPSNPPRFLP